MLLLSLILTLSAGAVDGEEVSSPEGEAVSETVALTAEEEAPPIGEGELVVEITVSDEEAITVETGEVEAPAAPSEEDAASELQQLVDEIVWTAAYEGETSAEVLLEGESYEIGTLLLHDYDECMESITLVGREGGTRINGDIQITDVVVELINIILGGDKTLALENTGETEGVYAAASGATVAEGERLNVLIEIPDGAEAGDFAESRVELEASPGAQVVADIEAGEVCIADGEEDSVTLSGSNTVAVRRRSSLPAEIRIKGRGDGLSTVNLLEVAAQSARLTVEAAVVNLREKVDVKSLKVIAASETRNVFDPVPDFLDSIPGIGGYTKDLGVKNVADAAMVNILSDITAAEDITVYSYVTQEGGLLGNEELDFGIAVKLGNAEINVAKGVKLSSGADVTLKSTIRAEAGYDQYGRNRRSMLPLSFNVFLDRTAVNIADDVSITAKGDILADAMSTIRASAECTMGLAPLSLAVNVIINEVETLLGKRVTLSADGNISLLSTALTEAAATAERSETADGLNGVYLAVNVIDQSSDARVADGDRIYAKGDVTVRSRSDVNATDDAISSATSAIDSGEGSSAIKDILTTVGSNVLQKVKNAFFVSPLYDKIMGSVGSFLSRMSTKLDKAAKLLGGSGYTVELDKAAQEKGSVKVNADTEGLKIKVNSNYQVSKVLVRYLLSSYNGNGGDETYSFREAVYDEKAGAYVLKLSDVNTDGKLVNLPEFRVYVFYGELKSEVELQDMSEEDDEPSGVLDLLDDALSSAADELEADEDCAGELQLLYSYTLNGKEGTARGSVVTDVMAATVTEQLRSASGLTGVKAGSHIRLNVNPARGFKLNTLSCTYTDGNGEIKTIDIPANAAGHYILQLPADATGSVRILADFTEAKAGEDNDKTPTKNQFSGALGVGVILNHNDAIIDVGEGYVSADGDLTLSAMADTNLVGTANGTSVSEADINKARTVTRKPTEKTMAVKTFTVDKSGEELHVIGAIGEEDDCAIERSGSVYTIRLSAATSRGYTLPETITLRLIGEDNREQLFAVSGENGVYSVDLSRLELENDGVSNFRSLSFKALLPLKTYALDTEVLSVVDPVTKLAVTYGRVIVDRTSVSGEEIVTVHTMPVEGYEACNIVLRYNVQNGGEVQEKYVFAVRNTDGTFTLQVPDAATLATAIDGVVKLYVDFREREGAGVKHSVTLDSSAAAALNAVEATAAGETVKLTLQESLQKTHRLHSENLVITYFNSKGERHNLSLNADTLSFVMPFDAVGEISVSVKDGAELTSEMKVTVKAAEGISNGSLTPQTDTTAAGSILLVKVEADKDYVIKAGSVKAEYQGGTTVNLGLGRLVEKDLYAFDVPAAVGNSTGTVTVTAEFVKGDTQTSSLGIGTAVGVVVHRNNARILSGSVRAGDTLTLTALTGGSAETNAISGYNATNTAIAGAVAVEVAGYRSHAVLSKGVIFSASDLAVNAESILKGFRTTADASGKILDIARDSGFGTGVAVAVNGVDTYATVEDGAVDNAGSGLKSISVHAHNALDSDTLISIAGARTAGKGIAPVVALNISGSHAESYLGKALTTEGAKRDYAASAVEVTAENTVAHSLLLDAGAKAFGTDKAVALLAGAFGINITNDLAEAILNAGVRAANAAVKVEAHSDSTLQQTVLASAAGTDAGKKNDSDTKGSADMKADALIQSGEKLAAANGTDAASPVSVSSVSKDRQTAQTSEGSIAGAAAFALNIQSNTSRALIRDGVNIQSATGDQADSIRVHSAAHTAADIESDASATLMRSASAGSDTGIGVAVAINIVNSENSAVLGRGISRAAEVLVKADAGTDAEGKARTNEFRTVSISGAGATGVSVAGSVALAVLNNRVSAAIEKDDSDSFSADVTTVAAEDVRIAETVATAAADALGAPDKNLNAGDSNKAADADSSKNVGVGASFAMVYGDNRVSATVLLPSNAQCGKLSISGLSDHSEESVSVAGRDPWSSIFTSSYPLKGRAGDIAVDASVAVNAVETVVEAVVRATQEYVPQVSARRVHISAKEKGRSSTSASGFALGGETAVGAAVAVNLNTSSVESRSECVLKVSGDDSGEDEDPPQRKSVDISAAAEISEDNLAYATAMGTDILRYVEKYKDILTQLGQKAEELDRLLDNAMRTVDALEKLMKSFLDGSLFDSIAENIQSAVSSAGKNLVSNKITELLNGKKTEKKASMGLPLSTNILRVFGVGTGSSEKLDAQTGLATKESNAAINGSDPKSDKSVAEALQEAGATGDIKTTELGNNAALNKEAESFQLAAALAVSVSEHHVLAENTAAITTNGGAAITAENRMDAKAHATGAAVSTNGGIGSIAMAVAGKVDSNETIARAGADILVGKGRDILISASLQENTSGEYAEEIGVQAVAGAVSGSAKVAISGAVAVFVSAAETVAELCDSARLMAADESAAGNVDILAAETSRQTLRTMAGAISQAQLSLGVSVGVFVTNNTLRARAGKNTHIKGGNIRVKAERRSVTTHADSGKTTAEAGEGEADYGDKEAPSDSKNITDVRVKGFLNDNTILSIDTTKATLTTMQATTVSIDTSMITEKLEQALNSLSGVDYYIAVDAGSASATGSGSSGLGSIAGSVATVVIDNLVESLVESGAILESDEDISVEADSAEQSRIIAGTVAVNASGNAKLAAGAVIGFVTESNEISAIVEDTAQLLSGRDLLIHAENAGRTELYTVTAAVSASQSAQAGVAATINVLLSESSVSAKLGKGKAHAAASAVVESVNSKALTLVTVSPAVGNAKVQVGGAVTVIVEQSSALTDLSGVELTLSGQELNSEEKSLSVLADNSHSMTTATASASAGRSDVAVAGVLSVVVDDSFAKVLAADSRIRSAVSERYRGGDVEFHARNESDLLQVNVEFAAGQSSVNTGASVLVSVLRRTVLTDAENAEMQVGNGRLSLLASGEDSQTIVGAGAGLSTGVSVQGNIVTVVENNAVTLKAENLRASTLRNNESVDRNDITLSSAYTSKLYGVAGSLNVSGGSVAAGATVLVLVNRSKVETLLNGAEIRSASVVNTSAHADNERLLVAVGAGISGGTDVQAAMVTAVTSDVTRVDLGNASVYATVLDIEAVGRNRENLMAGSASVGMGASVGPALLVFVKERTVEILSKEGGTMGSSDASCAIAAKALAEDATSTLVIAAGGGNVSVQAGVCVDVVKNRVLCDVDATAYAGRQNLSFSAESNSTLNSYAFGGGFGATVAVVPVITVVYQRSETLCEVSGDTHGYHLDVLADSALQLNVVEAGASAAGTAAISGSFAVVVNEAVTKALFTASHYGEAQYSHVNVLAHDDFDFESTMITLSGGGAAGVAVTAAVSIMKNTVEAAIDPRALGDAAAESSTIVAKNVQVAAESLRKADNVMDGVGIGGEAGVALNVAVLVSGSALPQDAYDSIVYGNGRSSAKTFDAAKLLNDLNDSNPYLRNHNYLRDVTLERDLVGNGQYDSHTRIGDADGIDTEGILPEDFTEDKEDYAGDNEKNIRENDKLRGEDAHVVPDPHSELSESSQLNETVNYHYDDAFQSMVSARVDNSVISSDTLDILARDTQSISMDTLTMGAGALGGGAAGVAVVTLHSNVLATLGSNAVANTRALHVQAVSDSDADGIAVTGGVFGGGAFGSAAVAVAVVHLDNVTAARMDGTLRRNEAFSGSSIATVLAASDYRKVDAETTAVSVSGLVEVGASVAIVTLNGTLASVVSGVVDGIDELNVLTNSNNAIAAHAADLGAGTIGVNSAVAVASETVTIRAAIEEGAVVSGLQEVRVMNVGAYDETVRTSESGKLSALAETVNISAGGISGNASAALSLMKNDVTALLAGTVRKGSNRLIVRVQNQLDTEALSTVNSLSAAGANVGGNIVLSYNHSTSRALVNGEVSATGLVLASYLSANATATMDEPSAAILSMGVNVAYAALQAVNTASVEGNRPIQVEYLTILAGATESNEKQGGNFKAHAQLYSGGVSSESAKLNLALAVNEAVNEALLRHSGSVNTGRLTMRAYANPTATSDTASFALGLFTLQGSAAASTLDFTQRVAVEGSLSGSPAVDLGSYLYAAGQDAAVKSEDAQTHARVEMSAAERAEVGAYVAYAKNETRSIVSLLTDSPLGAVILENQGGANALAEVVNTSYSAVSAGAVVALSYTQAQILTELSAPEISGSSLYVNTDFVTDALAEAEANQRGLSLGELSINVIIAKSTTTVDTLVHGLSGASRLQVQEVEITGNVESHTRAVLNKPDTYLSGVTVGGNVLESILSTIVRTTLSDFTLSGSPTVNVTSSLNADPNRVIDADADALTRYLGSAGGDSISVIAGKTNVLLSKNYAVNEALLRNISGGSGVNTTLRALSHATALSDGGSKADADGFSVAVIGAGAIVALAHNESVNRALAENYRAATDTLTIRADMNAANATSVGGVSSLGRAAAARFEVNYSEAVNRAVNEAILRASGTASDFVPVNALHILAEADEVYADAYVGTAQVDMAALGIYAAVAEASKLYSGSALVENSFLRGNGDAEIVSRENQNFFRDGAKSVTEAAVGASGSPTKNFGLVTGIGNSATASSASTVKAHVSGSTLQSYALSILAEGRSEAEARALTGSKVALLGVGVLETYAKADGTVEASFDATHNESVLRSLTIRADGAADAQAETSSAGSNIALVSGTANLAEATSELSVLSALRGGAVRVTGDAVVETLGTAIVEAQALTPTFSLMAGSVAVNIADADSHLQLSTEVTPESLTVDGSLTVRALVPTDRVRHREAGLQDVMYDESSTDAKVEPSAGSDPNAGSVSLTLVGDTMHKALAHSRHALLVKLGESGSEITADSILTEAVGNSNTTANSNNRGTTVALATIGSLYAEATTADSSSVLLGGSVTTRGDLQVQSRNDSANVGATGTAPGKWTVFETSLSDVKATIEKNVAGIEVEDGARLTSEQDIIMRAYNAGHGTAEMNAASSHALAGISSSSVPVSENYETFIRFGDNAQLSAGKGIRVETETNSYALSNVDQSVARLGFNIDTMYGNSIVNDVSRILLGAGTALTASDGDVKLSILQNADLFARTAYAAGFALYGNGYVRSVAEFNGESTVELGDNATLRAIHGNIGITQDSSGVETEAQGNSLSSSIAGSQKLQTRSTVNEAHSLILGNGASVRADGAVRAEQYSGTNSAIANSRMNRDSDFNFSDGYSRATVSVDADAQMELSKGSVIGDTLELIQKIRRLSMNPTAYASLGSFTSCDVDVISTASLDAEHRIRLGTVTVPGGKRYISSANGEGNSTVSGTSNEGTLCFNDGAEERRLSIRLYTDAQGLEERGVPAYYYRLNSDRLSFAGNAGERNLSEYYQPNASAYGTEPAQQPPLVDPRQPTEAARTESADIRSVLDRLEREGLLDRTSGPSFSETISNMLRSGTADSQMPDDLAAAYVDQFSAEWLRSVLGSGSGLTAFRIPAPDAFDFAKDDALPLTLVSVETEGSVTTYHFIAETDEGSVELFLRLDSKQDRVELYFVKNGERNDASAILSVEQGEVCLLAWEEKAVSRPVLVCLHDQPGLKSSDIRR